MNKNMKMMIVYKKTTTTYYLRLTNDDNVVECENGGHIDMNSIQTNPTTSQYLMANIELFQFIFYWMFRFMFFFIPCAFVSLSLVFSLLLSFFIVFPFFSCKSVTVRKPMFTKRKKKKHVGLYAVSIEIIMMMLMTTAIMWKPFQVYALAKENL